MLERFSGERPHAVGLSIDGAVRPAEGARHGGVEDEVNIDIVIPAFNARPHVQRLLRCLAHNVLDPGDSFEVIVVDDGSTDGTGDAIGAMVLPFVVTYLYLPRSPESGRAAARNAGIAKANGDVVLMVDADQVVVPDFVAAHIRYHRLRDDLVVVGPRGDLGDGEFDDERLAREFTLDAFPEIRRGDFREEVFAEFSQNFNQLATAWHHTFSCNVSVRREHIEAVGGFDEGFVGWGLEDSELAYRLHRRGLAFAYNPAATAYQQGRDLTPDMVAEWKRNLDYFVSKHAGAPEVAVQSIVGRAFDPEDHSIDWLEIMRRFEFAVRSLAGRLPEPVSYQCVEVDDANAAEIAARLPDLAAGADIVVIDDTAGAELAGPAQTVATVHELVYFRRPSSSTRDQIRSRFRAAS
jgi:glycosyltransferase involved in cell wall biosynthesis